MPGSEDEVYRCSRCGVRKSHWKLWAGLLSWIKKGEK